MEQTVKSRTFADIIAGDKLVLVDFYADWCGPCQMMPPILQVVKEKFSDKLIILKVDVDKNQKASAIYQVHSIPTLILFKNNQTLWRQAGVPTAVQLEQVIQSNL